ncbi:yemanuclein isoform X3 [Armigeres subalbatus]|uniref:yemanuclein isoform X3 n=1 Tax=Armigeres subalbatus TaxID=124917 RepID=UPI002ED0A4FF
MSEIKRVTLTTISDVVKKSPFGGALDQNTDSFFSGGGGAFGGSGSGTGGGSAGKNAASKPRKTVRLELELFEPTTQSFPEFNFSKLMHEEQKRLRKAEKKTIPNGFLSDADNDDDVARIARELEKKYGSGTAYSSTGKSARSSQLDVFDRGAGYDEEDSFIDNTEAYDELIPQEVETVGGGFYINSGQLEFKTLSNFERPEDAERMPKPKKRLLSTSSESDSEDETVKRKKKKEKVGSAATSGAESGKSGKTDRKRLNGHVGKKPKMGSEKTEGKLVLKKDKEDKESKESGKEVKVVKTITVKDMLRAKRDSMRKMEQEKKGRSSATMSSSEAEEDDDGDADEDEDDGSDESDSDSSDSDSDESESDSASGSEQEQAPKINGDEAPKKQNSVRLPDNLPDHLLQDLNDLKEHADKSTGRFNFFESTVADLLLQIDVSSRMCGGSARNTIYKHLEEHLRVSRQTLMIKIKKIRIRKEDNKVKKALDKLEDAVSGIMPKVITNYETEKQKAIELRNSLPPGENGQKPEVKLPKKKFPWNDQLRGMLFDIANIRKQSLLILRPRKVSETEFIQSYLQKNVVPLWPTGWMKIEDLQKELDRRKKNDSKSGSKEIKKSVHLSTATSNLPTPTLAIDPEGKTEPVLSPAVKSSGSKFEEKKSVRPPQSSPVAASATAASSPAQPPPSTSPAATKRTSDHSIINIISSPPSKTSSSQHSSQYPSNSSPQPPRPQSQPPRQSSNFDEDLIQTHVINLEPAHSSSKTSPLPMDFRINSPALSSASSASSSRRTSSYQEQPPMAHLSSTPGMNTNTNRVYRKSLDDDSDSSIEIVGEYNMGEKKIDHVLNLALPSINKDKYKKSSNAGKAVLSRSASESGSSTSGIKGSSGNMVNTYNNNNYDKPNKYSAKTSTTSVSSAPTSTIKSKAAESFAIPSSVASLINDFNSNAQGVSSRITSSPGELDVLRIMKELHAMQSSSSQSSRNSSSNSPKPSHSFGVVKPKQDGTIVSGSPGHHQSPKTPTPAALQQQKQQQAHHIQIPQLAQFLPRS